ncbi:hypothetical protein PMI04_015070 [Sphingobium sp. AP49]|uniref:hypothetical protein n=1 Tax=Sphingobium sp. AP49 TaxID=1144307 RepID=UPI00026ED96E|nr:hypothetical protein [Sphingobium sp. AP49]WHO37881.1 hypothetical protein PMI04_015070 [Sphingobium sp. AP49]
MPALPADIAAALRPQIVVSNEDATIKARFPSARNNSDEPSEGFFDLRADAETAGAQRRALIGAVRRRFAVTIDDMLPITAGVIPTHRLIDAEQGVDALMMVTRIEVDLEDEQTNVEYFG